MNQVTAIKPHTNWQHRRKGTIYIVQALTNQYSTDPDKFPLTVVYMDEQMRLWSRPAADFLQSFREYEA